MATPTSNLPSIQSYEQYLSDMLSSYASAIGINDFNTGSINTSFFETAALTAARASGDILQTLNLYSIDRATGNALQRLALEYGVNPAQATSASGLVNILDTSFTKISTNVYAGTSAPNIGSITINVSDASDFTSSGGVYIGRGTPNIEGPIAYSATPVQSGSFWVITLNTATTKYHNLGETVILAQGGNRTVASNTVVVAPSVGTSPNIQYGVVTQAVILDGETEVDNVQVTALIPGSASNVPADSVVAFASSPFIGAAVINPLPFTTGTDNPTDPQLRVQIKNTLASQGLGTATAVKAALLGASATESSGIVDTIVSDSLVTNTDGTATVYISNGTVYEETSNGVGLEFIVDSALGGEQFFQLQTGGTQAPVAQAYLQTELSEPFDLVGGDTLAIVVGGVTYQHVFADSDFASPNGATAYEVSASINADTAIGFEASTASNATYITVRGKNEQDEDVIFVTTPTTSGRDAAVLMGFPTSTIETLRLYKNNIPLSQDGSTASVFTQAQQLWSNTIANGDTLILSVDGTADISYSILNSDFIATGLYTSVNNDNSLASWVEVFNNKLTGITATIVGDQIELSSNLGANNRANVTVNAASTLVTKGMFSATLGLSSQGAASDFTLDRNTAQFELVVPLVAGDRLTAGSADTEASVTSQQFSSNTVILSANAHLWILVDTAGAIIPTGVIPNTILAVSKPITNTVRYTSNVPSAFSNVLPGDYLIVWSAELPPTDLLEGRVHAVTATTIDMLITPAEYAAVVPTIGVNFVNGFVVLRSNLAPQRFEVPAGTLTLDQAAALLQTQTDELQFSVFLEEFLVVSTNTIDDTGSVLIVTSDTQGQFLQLEDGLSSKSTTSLIAFYDSQEVAGDFPLFIHSTFSSPEVANPPDSYITALSTSVVLDPTDPNALICMLHPYGGIDDAQDYGEDPQISSLAGAAVTIVPDAYMHRVRIADRFYVGSPLQFGYGDQMVAVVDNNVISQSYTIPMYRNALTNNTVVVNSANFNAYDEDAGANASFTSYFNNFDFSNFKVYMQAKHVLKPTPSMTAILYRAAQWGTSGEQVTVAYTYPTGPNQPINSTVVIDSTVNISISLASGTVSTNSIAASTQWNVTITLATPNATTEQVTFTWNGTGTNPALTLSGGEYVNISTQSGFNVANTGIYRVSTQIGFAPTATSFTVTMPNGQAVAQSNILTTVNGAISLYRASSTTAAQVATYVNNNLASYLSATLANDSGTSGAGIIVLSTYEDSAFTSTNVRLLDGQNWLLSSNVSGSPQFVLKIPLSYSGAGPGNAWYAFNNGENLRFVPTTIEQVHRFISVLAVTGLTTVGTTELVDRGTRLELATQTLGSSGSIQIVGGSANSISLPVLNSATNINNNLTEVSVSSVASKPITSNQWYRLQAAQTQKKVTGFDVNTDVTVVASSPTTGEATVTITNGTLSQRNFGRPRNIQTGNSTFRVETQGSLVCISWTGVGSNPNFESALNFNDTAGGTANVVLVAGTTDAQYVITAGNVNFTELQIGDLFTIAGTNFTANNKGTFVVTGVSNNTVQITNAAATAQTGVVFVAGNFSANSGVSEGDTVIFSAPFSSLNQGQYRVIRQYNNSIWIENPNVTEQEVALAETNTNLWPDGSTQFNITIVNGYMRLTWNGTGTSPATLFAAVNPGDIVTFGTDFLVANRGSFMAIASSSTYVDVINSLAAAQSGVSIANVLQYYIPAMQFWTYEASVPGDLFVVTGNVLGLANAGSYPIVQVLNQNTAIVKGNMVSISNINLNNNVNSVYVEEGVAYSGFKRVYMVSAEPGTTTQSLLVFDTTAQYNKIDSSASVELTSIAKLNFNTTLRNGLDAYRYNTGLIAEANRITYGDPRDPITYPGTGAAGADIFHKAPLALRVTLAIDIRLLTGAPFSIVAKQVQSNVAYLINSNPVGQSIDLSSIVSVVRSIPGITSVAISSPLYSPTDDLIKVAPSEQSIIIDPATDISVSQIGV